MRLLCALALLTLVACRPDTTKDGVTPVDADADGYTASVDCDDADADVFPGAEEAW